MKPPWILAAVGVGFSGFLITQQLHQNVADRIRDDQPGTVAVIYSQPNPGLGKLLGIFAAGGVAGCLWMGLQEKESSTTTTTTTNSQATPVKQNSRLRVAEKVADQNRAVRSTNGHDHNALVAEVSPLRTLSAAPQYDEDPEINLEEIALSPKSTAIRQSEKIKHTSLDSPIALIAKTDSKKRHVFFACQTQTGKTTTVLAAIESKYVETSNGSEWTIFDPKQSFWMGLESLKNADDTSCVVNMSYDCPSDILKMDKKLTWAIGKMSARQKERNRKLQSGEPYNPKPHIFVFDEWPSTRMLASQYDEIEKEQTPKSSQFISVWKRIKRNFELLVLNGLEDSMIVWLITQMPDCEQNDINSGLRDQFAYWCQGRDGDYRSIEAALGNRWIVPPGQIRLYLEKEMSKWREKNSPLPIVYTNIGGHQTLQLPEILGIKHKLIFGNTTQNIVQFPKSHKQTDEPLEDFWEVKNE